MSTAVLSAFLAGGIAGAQENRTNAAGVIAATDIIKLRQCLTGRLSLSEDDYIRLDFNGDGVINSFDISEAVSIVNQASFLPPVAEITLPAVTTVRWMGPMVEVPYATVITEGPAVTTPVSKTEVTAATTGVTTTT
ncbi:MAG: dockerin type I repeat-containing protein, partial [Oscillospiraceae bacterium]|nr:dockerin type I repeat-containing protein [Oscillospiraceae bacterium]